MWFLLAHVAGTLLTQDCKESGSNFSIEAMTFTNFTNEHLEKFLHRKAFVSFVNIRRIKLLYG